ncbi:MAG: bifunctional oligoribonuclease/PAP phosphatase NrnA [Desulfobacterales bacterium]|nr:bifunctional oligoribonuclease/PAP phosphatase NrnA [Desulfobacterales bacterium]
MQQIVSHLKNSRSLLLATHIHPDGDAIGSLSAMGLALAALGKEITLHCASPIPAVYRFLPATNAITGGYDRGKNFDTAVILDCGDFERVGPAFSEIENIETIINIDHHVTNTEFGNLAIVDTAACATAEILYRLIKALGIRITAGMATAIYTGIFTDTGSFRFSNTNRAAFAICEEMVAVGMDPYKVAQNVYGTYSLGRIKLLNLALDSIELVAGGKASIMTLTREMLAETGTQPEDVDGLINYARRIEDVKLAVLLREMENDNRSSVETPGFHVSLRSDGAVDVAEIAATFGGGGHKVAAGFNIDLSIEEIRAKIVRLAEKL